MDIRQLDYFIVVAQLGSFTKAADELFLSRQALSKAVRNLEHELGQPLLANRDNHLELTDAGRTLLDDAAPVVEAFKQLERRHVGCVGAPALRRTLSVAMAHGTALSMPDRAIDAFREEHPDIVLSVEEVTTETAIDMVRTANPTSASWDRLRSTSRNSTPCWWWRRACTRSSPKTTRSPRAKSWS